MARARDLQNKKNKVIAVIGDGSLTGGMALEALNDAGNSKTDITVILNDNEMSISKNVGGVSLLLSKLRSKKLYNQSNNSIKNIVNKIPYLGKYIIKIVQRIKKILKQLIISNMYFEDIGFRYLGPVDGNNIEETEHILNLSNKIKGPILIHVITKKGKGYIHAENDPNKFHSISKFDIQTGKLLDIKKKDYSEALGNALINIAKKDKKIVAVTAAMKDGTGLKNFAEKFPTRFFDVGIAEQHALGTIAGLAKEGLKPILTIYSSFLQRGYDQLIHDIALQNLPVVIAIDRAGIVGQDGETHQGIYDLSFLNTIPNINIMAPKNFEELEQMLKFAFDLKKPVTIRYPRGRENNYNFEKTNEIILGKTELIKKGKDLTIIAIGNMVSRACEVSKLLKKIDISAEVINIRFLNPIDKKEILKSIKKTKKVVTIEDNILEGGLKTKITNILNDSNLEQIKIKGFGYSGFIKHGKVEEIEKKYKTDKESIFKEIKKYYKFK